MGLLDIWSDWKKDNQSQSDGFEDYTPTNGGTLDTAGGIKGSGINATMDRKSESPLVQNPIFTKDNFKKVGNKIYNALPGSDLDRKFAAKEVEKIQGTPKGEMMPVDNEEPSNQIDGNELSKDGSFMSKLAGMAGVDLKQAGANWKEKGGFEGLMSNPAFSLGLALMQSSANGKTINQGILDNFVKSAKISSEFKDRIEARKQEPIQATAGDVDEIKQTLKRFKISDPNIWEKGFSWLKGENATADFDRAAESIAIEYQKEISKMQRESKTNKPLVIDSKLRERIIKKIVNSKGVARKKSWFGPFTDDTLAEKSEFRAQGGPITQGKPYVVGEKGPEIIIPTSDGNVLSNDDSQIFNMLLASNPQLQKVSKQRAERILKSRFPEYFEG